MKHFTVRVPATTANLGPGYDALGMALDVFNEFEVNVDGEKPLEIDISGEGEDLIPKDENNLIYRAACRGFEIAGQAVPNLKIRQTNVVPANRGMGSSATAALGGLMIAKEVIGDDLPEDKLLAAAIEFEGHPDNLLAAYYGGVVLNYVEGDEYRSVRFYPQKRLRAVLAIPDIQVSTKRAREILPKEYPTADVVSNIRNVSLLMYTLMSGEYALLRQAMEDRIHQPYRASLIPGFIEAKHATLECGAFGVAISGSGSTIIAFCDSKEEDIARSMAEAFERVQVHARTKIVDISKQGAYIIRMGE